MGVKNVANESSNSQLRKASSSESDYFDSNEESHLLNKNAKKLEEERDMTS